MTETAAKPQKSRKICRNGRLLFEAHCPKNCDKKCDATFEAVSVRKIAIDRAETTKAILVIDDQTAFLP